MAWDEAPQRLQNLLETHRPIRYLGIGEGHPGRIAWEMLAHNEQSGTDETGLAITCSPIVPNRPPTLASTWPKPPKPNLTLLPADIPFVASYDAGRFLCNRVLWQALSQGATAAFLHLPPQGTDSNAAYLKKYAEFVKSLLV